MKNNVKVIMTARRMDKLQSIRNDILSNYPFAKVHVAQLDVRDRAAVNKIVAELPLEFKDVDVLINNAGLVIGYDHVGDISEDKINTIFDTNVKGLLNVTQAILPIMKARNKGHIINIGSIAGKESYPGGGVYCASKHAVHAITNSLRMELVGSPIRVSQISPGMVETEFSLVRLEGNFESAKKVYNGIEPLIGQDIAEMVVFVASLPDHVQIADMIVFPTNQASATLVHRQQ